ncbi:MAG TPA: CPBP family intramembrane glutamic endopeptidase [Gemmataceae bacterium]|nr:CPBP family intramembrane glutamic endopeptidase [Gemmataceae bacterium]
MNHDAMLPPAEPIPSAQPSVVRNIFIGKDGLRAGWSLLVFIALLAAVLIAANFVAHKIHPRNPSAVKNMSEISLKAAFINESIPLVIVLLVTWIMSKIERRPNSVYGLGGSRKVAHFFAGFAWGVVCLSLLVLSLWKTGLLVVDRRLLFGGDILRYGVMWLFGFLLVGLFEEFLNRGYLQYTLTRGLAGFYRWASRTRNSEAFGFWTSAVILAVLFGLGHSKNPGESPIGMLSAGLVGMVFCLSLWRTGSLWWAIGFHTAWDWSQSFLWGVADSGTMAQHHLLATHPVGKPILSGGATGPEGSIFIVAVLSLISLIILLTLPRTHYRRIPEPSI